MSSVNNIAALILAAGASTRLGRPKQLVEFDGITLVTHSVREACNSDVDIGVVLIGAHADLIAKEIDDNIVHVIANKDWEEGMASSIRLGLKTAREHLPKLDGVIIMVCDQPYISYSILNELIFTQRKTGKAIVTCNYGETNGPPTLFHKSLFNELMQLKGDVGAKKIVQQHIDETAMVLFPKGSIDIDTREDYESILKV